MESFDRIRMRLLRRIGKTIGPAGAAAKKTVQKALTKTMLLLVGLIFCAPILLLLTGSVMSRYELRQSLMPLMVDTEELITWTLFPRYPTFEHYFRILFITTFSSSIHEVYDWDS